MAEQLKMAPLSSEYVRQLAIRYLLPHQPLDYKLEVLPDGIKNEDDWWYVLVRPDRENVRAYDYYGRLAEAEISLRDEQNVNVLLVPVLPE